jgi:hypothetical protein
MNFYSIIFSSPLFNGLGIGIQFFATLYISYFRVRFLIIPEYIFICIFLFILFISYTQQQLPNDDVCGDGEELAPKAKGGPGRPSTRNRYAEEGITRIGRNVGSLHFGEDCPVGYPI